MSLVFKSKTEMCYFVFSILKLLQQKWKEMFSSYSYLNFINKSGTESRFILLYLTFHKSLIPTQSCLWFLSLGQRCVQNACWIGGFLNFNTATEIEIISFLQCIVCYCFCNSNIFYIDKVYGSHFCLTVKNQRHDMAGINDCENLGMVKF